MSETATKPREGLRRPELTCACGRVLELAQRRIGDSLRCPGCGALQVLTRSKVRGEVPPAQLSAHLEPSERREVDECLKRIRLRRIGRASRHLELYPNWAVLLAIGQFYLAGILAGQNLIALGERRRGRRLQVLGVLGYLAMCAAFIPAVLYLGHLLPIEAGVAALVGAPLLLGGYFAWTQFAATGAARQAGARSAPVVLPLLIGVILAIAQAFAFWFLKLLVEPPAA